MNNSSALVDDLKLLAAWVDDIEPGKPGTFAATVLDKAIKDYGADCDNLRDHLIEQLSNHELECLKGWIGYTFNDGELLMLDIVLITARAEGASTYKNWDE